MSLATITKSIRLSPQESAELTLLSEQNSLSESALMKKWIQDGIQAEKMERAIRAYMDRTTDLRGGAVIAGVSFNHFMHEVESRRIVIVDDDGHFLDRLSFLAEAFDAQDLRKAITTLRQQELANTSTTIPNP